MSPATASDICRKSGINAQGPLYHPTDGQWQQLHATWRSWIQAVENGSFSAATAEDGSVSMIGAYPNPASALLAVDAYYRTPQASVFAARSLVE